MRRETTERMYGKLDNETYGSPALVTGNLRVRVDASDRKNTGMVEV